jgi:hypothetical protein
MRRNHPDERGATAIIVALSLTAILGMVVLTVDVGQLLFKRRAMVNASDAAALAAAQSCAGLGDSDDPELMADAFAIDNVSGLIPRNGGIRDAAGCDGDGFGHVTVEYQVAQRLFFAGILGFKGPGTVKTSATAGWGPTGAAHPLPIAVYSGNEQAGCRIDAGVLPDRSCYLWYDNVAGFTGSGFGFVNLCSDRDPCGQGWGVDGGARCTGSRDLGRQIDGTWVGGPNEINYPAVTYACRVSVVPSNVWNRLAAREGDELLVAVDDCSTQVNRTGAVVGCARTPHKYNIIGFTVLRLDQVLEYPEWVGRTSSCEITLDMRRRSPDVDLDAIARGLGCTPYDAISNVQLAAPGNPPCCTEGPGGQYLYDPVDHIVDWTGGVRDGVTISWDYSEGGPCGVPPDNRNAVCLLVTTVDGRFGGSGVCEACPDFGVRAVQLCDIAIGSCPEEGRT